MFKYDTHLVGGSGMAINFSLNYSSTLVDTYLAAYLSQVSSLLVILSVNRHLPKTAVSALQEGVARVASTSPTEVFFQFVQLEQVQQLSAKYFHLP